MALALSGLARLPRLPLLRRALVRLTLPLASRALPLGLSLPLRLALAVHLGLVAVAMLLALPLALSLAVALPVRLALPMSLALRPARTGGFSPVRAGPKSSR